MTMMEDFNQWGQRPPVPPYYPSAPPSGFNIEPTPSVERPMERRPMAEPSWVDRTTAQVQPSFAPAPVGEMIGEKMEWDSPYSSYVATDMLHPNEPWFDERYAAAQAAAQAAIIADMGRTTTMGTGWGRQPLIDPPPTYDYTGTGGLEGLPLSPFIPTANTLLPPANQEMIGNWGGGAANRQEWTGPLANPFPNIWNPFETYRYPGNTFWGGGYDPFVSDRQNSMQNFASSNWPYLAWPNMYPYIEGAMKVGQGIQGGSDWLRSRGY